MSRLLELRQRIAAVEQIRILTRTLATVSAARLSRVRRRAAGLRDYAGGLRAVLSRQRQYLGGRGSGAGPIPSLLEEPRAMRAIALLVITGDRGMCGGYNLEACRHALAFWRASERAGIRVRFLVKGTRGAAYLKKHRAEILQQWPWQRGAPGTEEVERLLGLLLELHRTGQADAVYAVYTEFQSAVRRRPRTVRLLPVPLPDPEPRGDLPEAPYRWYYEPGLAPLIDELVAAYLHAQLHQVLLASYASEQGARMVTMDEATERADRALQEYRVRHNRLRRETITTDLLGALYASRVARGPARSAAPHD